MAKFESGIYESFTLELHNHLQKLWKEEYKGQTYFVLWCLKGVFMGYVYFEEQKINLKYSTDNYSEEFDLLDLAEAQVSQLRIFNGDMELYVFEKGQKNYGWRLIMEPEITSGNFEEEELLLWGSVEKKIDLPFGSFTKLSDSERGIELVVPVYNSASKKDKGSRVRLLLRKYLDYGPLNVAYWKDYRYVNFF